MDLRSLVIITVCIQCAQGIFIPSATRDFRKKAAAAAVSTETEYSDLLRDLAVIKLKLETMSYGPVYLEGPYDNGPMAKSLKDSDSPDSSLPSSVAAEDPPSQFNEMAVLELIPVIIEQKRRGNVSPDEETTLKEIFGDLWIVIEEEVSRTMDEEMNPILKALLQSNNDGRLKRALVQHHQQQEEEEEEDDQQRQYNEQRTGLEVEEKNDIFGNSVDRVRVTRWPKSFVEVNLSQLSPQQRLMRRAAFQIRRWFDFNSSPQMGTRGVRGGLKHNNRLNKIKRNRGSKKRGSAGRRPGQRRMRKTGGNHNKQRGGEGRLRKRQQNLRPKRHNTEIYVDDNHGYFDYEDFEDHSFDDMMTKPRTMRSSRLIFDEYDSMENDDLDAEEYED